MKKGNAMSKQETDAENIVERVMQNPELLTELLDGIASTKAKERFESAKILKTISERNPRALYSNWDFFVKLLENKNRIVKWIAIDIIANLTAVDSQNLFDSLFKNFYSCLYEGNLITAAHVVDNSGKIALSKPELRDKITKELLNVEKIPVPTKECRNILIGKTIEAFQVYYDKIKDKNKVVSFAKRQLHNPRNSTKSKAEKFLRRLETQ
jgi:hypothetical protein